jgi:hypothetical protein
VQTLGTTRFLINSTGNVGIGFTTLVNYHKFQVLDRDNTAIYGEGRLGVLGSSYNDNGTGVFGKAHGPNGWGVFAVSDHSYGIYARTYDYESFAGYFGGDVYSSGTFQPSDEKLKQNITEVKNATAILNQLKPKHYDYKTEGSFAQMHLPKGKQFGLLSQDVEQVLPGLVKQVHHTDKSLHSDLAATGQASKEEVLDFKAVNYTGLIPIMIQAMQEQEAKNKEQEAKINALTEEIAKLKEGNNTGNSFKLMPADLTGVSLEQNQPNPVGANTTFRYTIPNNVFAQILMYSSASGKLVKTLQAPANGQVDMNASDLEAGTYIYTLVVNGKQTAAKQMVLSK